MIPTSDNIQVFLEPAQKFKYPQRKFRVAEPTKPFKCLLFNG
jgi:disulfide oxidoreductase YuzD